MFDPFYKKDLRRRIDEWQKPFVERLRSGGITDWADYKRVCGLLEGSEKVFAIISEMEKKAHPGDDY